MSRDHLVLVCAFAFGVAFAATVSGEPIIHLEWRPAAQTVPVGATVGVGLYAVSGDGTDIPLSVMDVILDWNPSFLSLSGVNNNGPYAWLFSGFPGAGDSGLNDDWSDGDAFYNAQSQLGSPAPVSPAGLLVTTVQFVALAETPGTALNIPETLGGAETIVINDTPGLDIHGTLGSATIEIVPEPATLSLLAMSAALALALRRRER